jgi:hypothetical protein
VAVAACGLLVVMGAAMSCLPAVAQNEAPSRGANRTLTFLDSRPLKVDFDALERAGGKLVVHLRNNTRHRKQRFQVRLVGLQSVTSDPGLQKLQRSVNRKPKKRPKALRPGEIRSVVLRLDTSTRPKADASGVLVAAGSLGAVRRRDFTLTVKDTTPPPEEPRSAIQPKTISDFSIRGTNYLTSLLSPLPPALFGAGVLLLIMASLMATSLLKTRRWFRDGAVFLALLCFGAWSVLTFGRDGGSFSWLKLVFFGVLGILVLVLGYGLELVRRYRKRPMTLPRLALQMCLGTVGIGLIVACAVTMIGRTSYTDAPSPRVIKVQAPLVADTEAGVVGSLVAPDGTVAMTEIEGKRLDVDGLERADKYEGMIDLLPEDDKLGAAKLTANVRDFWVYALLLIALGVLIGYGVTNYFSRIRPMKKQDFRIIRIRDQIEAGQSAFEQSAAGRPVSALSMQKLADARIAEAQASLRYEDTDDAGKMIDDLESYVKKFEAMRTAATTLDQLISRLEQELSKTNLGFPPEQVLALKQAKEAVAGPFDSSDPDPDMTRLDAKSKTVNELVDLLKVMVQMMSALSTIRPVDTSLPGWTDELRKEFSKQRKLLRKAAQSILESTTVAKANEQWANVQSAYREMLDLIPVAPTIPELMELVESMQAALDIGPPLITSPEESEAIRVSYSVEPGRDAEERVGTDKNRFKFAAADVRTEGSVYWDFGDGTRSAPLLAEGELPEVRHEFTTAGTHQVQLKDQNEAVLQELTVESSGPSRVDIAWRELLGGDRQMTYVTGFLTIGSGFLSLYLASDHWGSPANYLEALLWGSVVSEGLKYVTNMVGKVWKPTA